jgi:hypothetical protein
MSFPGRRWPASQETLSTAADPAKIPTITKMTTMSDVPHSSASVIQIFPALAGIELTTSQQCKITQLAENMLSTVVGILNPAQQDQLRNSMQQGTTLREFLLSLNLSLAQKWKLQASNRATRIELSQLLTSEQEEQRSQNFQRLIKQKV